MSDEPAEPWTWCPSCGRADTDEDGPRAQGGFTAEVWYCKYCICEFIIVKRGNP